MSDPISLPDLWPSHDVTLVLWLLGALKWVFPCDELLSVTGLFKAENLDFPIAEIFLENGNFPLPSSPTKHLGAFYFITFRVPTFRVLNLINQSYKISSEKGEKRGEGEDGRQLLKVDVSKRIMSYLQDSSRHVQEPWFRVPEFVDWLFSRENQVCM